MCVAVSHGSQARAGFAPGPRPCGLSASTAQERIQDCEAGKQALGSRIWGRRHRRFRWRPVQRHCRVLARCGALDGRLSTAHAHVAPQSSGTWSRTSSPRESATSSSRRRTFMSWRRIRRAHTRSTYRQVPPFTTLPPARSHPLARLSKPPDSPPCPCRARTHCLSRRVPRQRRRWERPTVQPG